MKAKLFLVFLGLTFGGLVYQSFKPEPNFLVVLERSYFEGWALLTYWFIETYFWKDE